MKVYLVGTGTEGCRTLTAEAMDAINEASLLIGAKRMLASYSDTNKTLFCEYQPDKIISILRECTEPCAAVLLSGDCGFFSGAKKLLPLLSDMDVTVIPGISSMSAFCAKCHIPYENMCFISLHGNTENIAIHVKMNRYCFFLLGGDVSASQICNRLCDYGLTETLVHIGSNISYKNETIHHGKVSDFLYLSDETLTVMITENHQQICYIPSAIPDSDFIRSNVPITKAEVRCNAVSALQISRDAICWDIGCGTGSVSVEMAFRCPDGHVFAFDKNEQAVHLTEQNAHLFACDHIYAVVGNCPDILDEFPAPNVVFIGGTSGEIYEILHVVARKNSNAKIAMTVVSLESLFQAGNAFEQYCGVYQVVQIAVTRTKKIGSHTMLDAQNPVFLITGGLRCSES